MQPKRFSLAIQSQSDKLQEIPQRKAPSDMRLLCDDPSFTSLPTSKPRHIDPTRRTSTSKPRHIDPTRRTSSQLSVVDCVQDFLQTTKLTPVSGRLFCKNNYYSNNYSFFKDPTPPPHNHPLPPPSFPLSDLLSTLDSHSRASLCFPLDHPKLTYEQRQLKARHIQLSNRQFFDPLQASAHG